MKTNQLKYSIEQIKEFGEYYKSGHSLKETSERFNINYHTLKQNLIRFGYRTPSKKLNNQRVKEINYFDKINTPEKAYYLGYLFSDGYISTTPYGKSIGIALQLKDQYILEFFKNELNVNNKISIYKNSCKIQLSDAHMYAQLLKLGVKENKSHEDYHLPKIKDKFFNSFLLGYFDGDGCITIKSTGYSVVSICGNSKSFLEELKQKMESFGIMCRDIITEQREKNPLYVLYLSKRENQLKFMDFIYKNCKIFLKRKYNKFLQIPRKS